MLSWFLIVGGLAMLAEGCVWARRKGMAINVATVLLLSIVLPLVDLGRLSLLLGRLTWTWVIEPDVIHARIRLERRRNQRQYLRQNPVARAVIEGVPARHLPPAPAPAAILPPPPAVPVVEAMPAGPVATAIQVRLPDGTVQWQPMELRG